MFSQEPGKNHRAEVQQPGSKAHCHDTHSLHRRDTRHMGLPDLMMIGGIRKFSWVTRRKNAMHPIEWSPKAEFSINLELIQDPRAPQGCCGSSMRRRHIGRTAVNGCLLVYLATGVADFLPPLRIQQLLPWEPRLCGGEIEEEPAKMDNRGVDRKSSIVSKALVLTEIYQAHLCDLSS